ncbi:MAG: hypothetical protein HY363_00400 [Candidatus Aenigmarchaeota archaeon]|nr:hypothetical protein [Candidatus Aenigmarchaeota archaeon]
MKLVVDTNVLFTFFWKNSIARELFVNLHLELYSPDYALEEIKKHAGEIIKKTRLSESEFNSIRNKLVMMVSFVPLEEYGLTLQKALRLTPDKDDVDFFALALKLNCPIWSNDFALKVQNHVIMLNTKDIITLMAALKERSGIHTERIR